MYAEIWTATAKAVKMPGRKTKFRRKWKLHESWICGAAATGEGQTRPRVIVRDGDLPLWIEQLSPQVISIELMSHVLRLLAGSELELSNCRCLYGSDTESNYRYF